jgi:hypothetical protein
MTTLAEARAEIAGYLEAVGIDVITYVPEELPSGVVAVIDAEDDFLTIGETYMSGEVEVWAGFKVYVLAELVSNMQATTDLDTALGPVLAALNASPWEVGNVSKPGPFHTTTWLAHGVAIPVRNILTLTKE